MGSIPISFQDICKKQEIHCLKKNKWGNVRHILCRNTSNRPTASIYVMEKFTFTYSKVVFRVGCTSGVERAGAGQGKRMRGDKGRGKEEGGRGGERQG